MRRYVSELLDVPFQGDLKKVRYFETRMQYKGEVPKLSPCALEVLPHNGEVTSLQTSNQFKDPSLLPRDQDSSR